MVQVEYQKCRCHLYDYKLGKRISESLDNDIEYCDRFISISPSDYGKLSNVMIDLRKLSR